MRPGTLGGMSQFSRRPFLRWAVPALAVLVLAAGTSLAAVSASADPTLPDRTPAQLLVDVQGARLHAGSGTVVQTSDLGLPDLSVLGTTSGGSAVSSVLSGTHTWRVWYSGPTKARVALIGSLGESDVIRHGPDAWIWDSAKKSAVHYRMGSEEPGVPVPVPGAVVSHLPATPEQAASAALAAVEPTTTVTTDRNVVVTGRPAYELVITPKSAATLVASVRIAVDGTTYLPLRVQVFSTKRATPAFEVGFTQVSFDTPEDRQFDFAAPAGTTVTEGASAAGSSSRAVPASPPSGAPMAGQPASRPQVVGAGWSAVLVVSLPPTAVAGGSSRSAGTTPGGDQLATVLGSLPRVSGAWGSGRLFEGTLVCAVLADDGRVAVGAVGPDLLYTALTAR